MQSKTTISYVAKSETEPLTTATEDECYSFLLYYKNWS